MKNLILGGYSCILNKNNISDIVNFADNILTPLLQYLYKNVHFEFTLYLSGIEMEWLEKNRPGLQRMIYRLIRRKSLSLLISTKYHGFMPLSTSQDIIEQTEQLRFLTRKFYKSKCKGFFSFGGFWSPEIISKLTKNDITYTVLPTFRKNKIFQSPFYMSEHNKGFVVYPSDYYLEEKVNEYCRNEIDFDKFKSDVEKYAAKNDRERNISFFLNFDLLTKNKINSFFVVDMLFNVFRESGFKISNTDNDVSSKNIDYLCAGSYYYDDNYIGNLFKDESSFNKIALINYSNMLLNDKSILKSDKDNFKLAVMPLNKGNNFIKDYLDDSIYESDVSSFLSYIYSSSIKVPDVYSLDSLNLKIIKKKNYLALLDTSSGFIRYVFDTKNAKKIIFSEPSFRDIYQDSKKYYSFVKFSNYIVSNESTKEIELTYINTLKNYTVTKTFSFLQDGITCNMSFLNSSNEELNLNISQFFCLEDNTRNSINSIVYSAEYENLINDSDFLKSNINDYVNTLKKENVYLPKWNISILPGEKTFFSCSVNVSKINHKEKKTLEVAIK